MNRQALADRIVTYSDALVAFALVNGFAFLITLSEPDIRCSIAQVSSVVFSMNVILPIVSTYALVWLRGYEARLRSDVDDETDELVLRFWQIAFVVRIVLIWLFGLLVIVGIFGATLDPRCTEGVG